MYIICNVYEQMYVMTNNLSFLLMSDRYVQGMIFVTLGSVHASITYAE